MCGHDDRDDTIIGDVQVGVVPATCLSLEWGVSQLMFDACRVQQHHGQMQLGRSRQCHERQRVRDRSCPRVEDAGVLIFAVFVAVVFGTPPRRFHRAHGAEPHPGRKRPRAPAAAVEPMSAMTAAALVGPVPSSGVAAPSPTPWGRPILGPQGTTLEHRTAPGNILLSLLRAVAPNSEVGVKH